MTIVAQDVFDWLGTATPTAPQTATMTKVVEAVLANIGRTHAEPVAAVPPAVPPVPLVDADWNLGITMQCARFWKRKASPEGVISASDFGVIRVSRFDGDIETMLSPFMNFVFA